MATQDNFGREQGPPLGDPQLCILSLFVFYFLWSTAISNIYENITPP